MLSNSQLHSTPFYISPWKQRTETSTFILLISAFLIKFTFCIGLFKQNNRKKQVLQQFVTLHRQHQFNLYWVWMLKIFQTVIKDPILIPDTCMKAFETQLTVPHIGVQCCLRCLRSEKSQGQWQKTYERFELLWSSSWGISKVFWYF